MSTAMPRVAYIENGNLSNSSSAQEQSDSHRTPEPPTRYHGNPSPPPNDNGPQFERNAKLASAKRLATAAQVMALVSLIIGGVFLSAAALAVAILAFRRTKAMLQAPEQDATAWAVLKRSATIAIALAVFALAANIATLIFIYPMVMGALESNGYGSLFAPSGSGSSTWG